jgi:hypothetical protein
MAADPELDHIWSEIEMLTLSLYELPTTAEEQQRQQQFERQSASKRIAVGYHRCMKLLNEVELRTDFDRVVCSLLADIRDRMIDPVRSQFAAEPSARRAFDACKPSAVPLPIFARDRIKLIESAINKLVQRQFAHVGAEDTSNGAHTAHKSEKVKICWPEPGDDRDLLVELEIEGVKPKGKRRSITEIATEFLADSNTTPHAILTRVRRKYREAYDRATAWKDEEAR